MKRRTRTAKSGQAVGTGGIGWVARREFIESNSLYDACVVGGGDGALTCTIFGASDVQVNLKSMNAQYAKHYQTWAHQIYADLRDNFGVIPSEVFHLWHGDIKHRRYWQRHDEFSQFDYDPYNDITYGENGCWKWSSDKPKMHQWVHEYLLSRREDG
jgi:hypothetical protein